MSDKHTAYRGDSYYLPQDGEAPQNQQQFQYGSDANGAPLTQEQANWAQNQAAHNNGGYAHQQDPQYAAPETAQGQGVDYSGIYGDAAAPAHDPQAYQQNEYADQGYPPQQYEAAPQNQYAQGYEAPSANGYQYEEVDPYLAAHQNATPPFDAGQHSGQPAGQDQYNGFQEPQEQSYYAQAHMDAGQAHFVDQAQAPADQMPAVYGQGQPQGQAGYDPYYQQQPAAMPPVDPYAQNQAYGNPDYNGYGAAHIQPHGMPQVNDPYAPHAQHQPMAANVDDDFQSSGRKSFLVGTMILGSVIIGGGVAFAYKYSGDGSSQNAPMIVADAGKSKIVPDDPGGRELANQSKKIFARLGDPKSQDDPVLADTAKDGDPLGSKVKDPGAVAAKPVEVDAAGGPHRVKTYRIDRNGNRIAAESIAAVGATPKSVDELAGVKVDTGNPPRTVKTLKENAPVKEKPVLRQEIARVTPKTETPAAVGSGTYVVQISARRTEQDALTAFSGLQGKYGNVLNGYRPLIQRADLGSKGVWYRLRVGPMATKDVAGNVCSQLKTKGLSSCFVTAR